MSFELVVITAMIGLIIMFVALAFNTENILLRNFFIILSMLSVVISLNTSSVIAANNGVGSDMVNLLKTSYILGIWILFVVIVMMVIATITYFIAASKERKLMEDEE